LGGRHVIDASAASRYQGLLPGGEERREEGTYPSLSQTQEMEMILYIPLVLLIGVVLVAAFFSLYSKELQGTCDRQKQILEGVFETLENDEKRISFQRDKIMRLENRISELEDEKRTMVSQMSSFVQAWATNMCGKDINT
jgi:hypothetical protein